jgi:hypothetical protein
MEGVKERQLAAAKRERKAAEAKAAAEAEEQKRQASQKKSTGQQKVTITTTKVITSSSGDQRGRTKTISISKTSSKQDVKARSLSSSSGVKKMKRARHSTSLSSLKGRKGKRSAFGEEEDEEEQEEEEEDADEDEDENKSSKDRKKSSSSSSSLKVKQPHLEETHYVAPIPSSDCCAVCGRFDDEDTDNPLITCNGGSGGSKSSSKSRCSLRVHAECFGVKYLHGIRTTTTTGKGLTSSSSSSSSSGCVDDNIPASIRAAAIAKAAASPIGAMTCSLCRTVKYQGSSRPPPPCALCLTSNPSNRAMKRVRNRDPAEALSLSALEKEDSKEDVWAHIACAMWTPETFFWHPVDKDYIGGVDQIDPKRYKLPCAICVGQGRKIGGAPIQCQSGACSVSFHVLCCRELGWEMVDMEYKSGVLQQSFCGRHSSVDFLRRAAELEAACTVCNSSSNSDSLLLCDRCGAGHHMGCLNPPLRKVPANAWYCPTCAVKETAKLMNAGDKGVFTGGEDDLDPLKSAKGGGGEGGGGGLTRKEDISTPKTTSISMARMVGYSSMNSYFQNTRRFFPNFSSTPTPPLCDAAEVGPTTWQEHSLANYCLQSIAAMLPIASASDVPIIAVTGMGNLVLPATALACALGSEVSFWNLSEPSSTAAIMTLRPAAALAVSRFDHGLPGGSGSGIFSSSMSSSSKVQSIIAPPKMSIIVLNCADFVSSDILYPLITVLEAHKQSQQQSSIGGGGRGITSPRFNLQLFVICESNSTLLRLQRTALTARKRVAVLDASNFDSDPGATLRFTSQFSTSSETLISERGTAWVLKSLTANHRALLNALTDVVTEAQPSISFDSLLGICNESMIASTDSALRGVLSELCDHGIVELDRKNNLVTLKVPTADVKAALLTR